MRPFSHPMIFPFARCPATCVVSSGRASFTYFAPNTYPNSRGFDLTTLGLRQSLVDQITKLATPEGLAFPVVYVDDDAMFMFTPGQSLRIRAALAGPRAGLTR